MAAGVYPMVGFVKDSDAPARKPFQTSLVQINVPIGNTTFQPLATVVAQERSAIVNGWIY